MSDSYVIYNKTTGDVYMTLQTNDPTMVLLNTPTNYEAVKTNAADFGLAKAVDLKTKRLKIASQS